MPTLTRRPQLEPLALLVRADPERDERAPCRVAALPRVQRDALAEARAILHPDGEAGEPLEDGFLFVEHGLLLFCASE